MIFRQEQHVRRKALAGLVRLTVTAAISVASFAAPASAVTTFCSDYANAAVKQYGLDRDYACGHSGPRWHGIWDLHEGWCKLSPPAFATTEYEERNRLLRACGVPEFELPFAPISTP